MRHVSAGRRSRPATPRFAQTGSAAGMPPGKPAAAIGFPARYAASNRR